jgi:hypothetical protein
MKKIFFLFLFFSFITLLAKSQDLTTNENYIVTYTIKVTEITSAAAAKDASIEFQKLFDSNLQTYIPVDQSISIKSVYDGATEMLKASIADLGYTLISFTKTYRNTITTEK